MVEIMAGKLPSAHHFVYHHGTNKQKQKLKYANKYGPIKDWPSDQVTNEV